VVAAVLLEYPRPEYHDTPGSAGIVPGGGPWNRNL